MKANIVIILSLLWPALIQASGSYTSRPPRPPALVAAPKDADRERYELGKKIYSGKARLSGEAKADMKAAQQSRLKVLQARLPESAQKNTNLPALAGRLTPSELDALEYYVNKRFPVK